MATIALIVIIAVLAAAIFTYNNLVRLRNRVENGWKQIDVQLKRRHDLIPNLVEAVKGAMQFERDTLERVMQALPPTPPSIAPRARIALATPSAARALPLAVDFYSCQARNRRRTVVIVLTFVGFFLALGFGIDAAWGGFLEPHGERLPVVTGIA